MSDEVLILYEEEIRKIDSLLTKMLKGAEAKCALLVDKDGHLITRQGFTHSLDTTALAALLAALPDATELLTASSPLPRRRPRRPPRPQNRRRRRIAWSVGLLLAVVIGVAAGIAWGVIPV